MLSHAPFLRPWYRSVTLWGSLLIAAAIVATWIDSRYHRTEVSSGGTSGIWMLNNRSAFAIGFWTGRAMPSPAEFRIDDRNPEYFTWIRLIEVNRSDEDGVGGTLYMPHYMLLPAWLFGSGMVLVIRWRRKKRVLRQMTVEA